MNDILTQEMIGPHKILSISVIEGAPFEFFIQQLFFDDIESMRDSGMSDTNNGGVTVILSLRELYILKDTLDKYFERLRESSKEFSGV